VKLRAALKGNKLDRRYIRSSELCTRKYEVTYEKFTVVSGRFITQESGTLCKKGNLAYGA
jgi:hypothetical protein